MRLTALILASPYLIAKPQETQPTTRAAYDYFHRSVFYSTFHPEYSPCLGGMIISSSNKQPYERI